MKRRQVLKAWVVPVVSIVTLPAHATMTLCGNTSILGSWGLYVNDFEYASGLTFILLPDGTIGGTRFVDEWSFDGETITIRQDISDWIFTGTFDTSCNRMEGAFISYTDEVVEGTWYAIRI